MKKSYVRCIEILNNSSKDVKSAEGDNIKYPKVKRAYQTEDTTAGL